MQEENFDRRELLCVNVDKVYDWIIKENSFEFSPKGPITFYGVEYNTNLNDARVECEVVPATYHPIEILDRENRHLCINGEDVCLQQLTIRKNFMYTLIVTLPNGKIFRSKEMKVSRNEIVTLCAPEGTDVELTFTEFKCFILSTGKLDSQNNKIEFSDLDIAVSTCQSIQSTFPVTVELFAEFCEPREDFIMGCSAPVHPPQCPSLFPDHRHCH